MSRKEQRVSNLIVNGVPKYVRCYTTEGTKNETLDCITVVFTKKRVDGQFMYIGASVSGAGFYQHGFTEVPIDSPNYGFLGKKVKFTDLTPELQNRILIEYKEIWNI
jgi:hypothetical protein